MSVAQRVHTADLDLATRTAARELLDRAFAGEFTDHDWEHSLGGVHALVWDGATLVGHGSVVQRRLLHGGKALRAGYVEGVGVDPAHQGKGNGAALMEVLEQILRDAYELGALASTDEAITFYTARGWQQWRGPLFTLTPQGTVRTEEEDGAVFVLPGTAPLDLDAPLTCDWRDGDVW